MYPLPPSTPFLLPAQVTLLLTLLLAASGCGTPADSPAAEVAGRSVRIMCWNIHHGRGLDGAVDLERLAAEIRAQDVDLVALQEVDQGTARTDRVDMPRELAAALGMEWRFGHNLDFQGGAYGNALLSRLPIAWATNDHYQMLREGEQRGLLRVGIDDGAALEVWVTHLDYRPNPDERLANAAEIRDALARTSAPVVLVGDFNALPVSPTHQALVGPFADAWSAVEPEPTSGATYPAADPAKRIDWVLFTPGRGLRPTAGEVPPTTASDHRPLVVEFWWEPTRAAR